MGEQDHSNLAMIFAAADAAQPSNQDDPQPDEAPTSTEDAQRRALWITTPLGERWAHALSQGDSALSVIHERDTAWRHAWAAAAADRGLSLDPTTLNPHPAPEQRPDRLRHLAGKAALACTGAAALGYALLRILGNATTAGITGAALLACALTSHLALRTAAHLSERRGQKAADAREATISTFRHEWTAAFGFDLGPNLDPARSAPWTMYGSSVDAAAAIKRAQRTHYSEVDTLRAQDLEYAVNLLVRDPSADTWPPEPTALLQEWHRTPQDA